MADTLEIFGTEYDDVAGFKAKDDNSNTLTYIRPQGTKSITANGTGIDVASYASVDVSVSGGATNLETITKTYTPSTTAITDTITASSGYDAIEEVDVTVNAVPTATVRVGQTNEFVTESNVRKWALTEFSYAEDEGWVDENVALATDTYTFNAVPSGTTITPTTSSQTVGGTKYMMEGAVTVNAMPSGSATTPATTITANPTISVNSSTGLITATASASQSVSPTVSAGYVSSGTAGTITVSGSNTSQLSTQAGTTITPTTSQQTAVAAGKYTTGNVVVDAVTSAGNVSGYAYIVADPTLNASTGLVEVNGTGTVGYVEAENSGWVNVDQYGEIINARVNYEVVGSLRLPTQSATTITPTESSQTAVASGKYTTGAVTVNAIPSNYVGSGITRRTSNDMSVSGYAVTAAEGYYETSATTYVQTGTAGTPTATKGTVSNHSVTITPSVTNTTGYITGSTINGTAVSVSASELVSGTLSVTSSGTTDVTNYANVSVPAFSGGITTGQGFYTENNARKWRVRGEVYCDDGDEGIIEQDIYGNYTSYNAVPSGTSITPSASSQSIGGANYMMEGAVTVTGDADLVAGNIKKDITIFGVTGTYEGGGGGSSVQIGNVMNSAVTTSTITFSGLQGEPTSYVLFCDDTIATGTPSKVAALVYDGTSFHGQTITNTSNAQVTYNGSSFSHTYNNGTLTITSTSPQFVNVEYYLVYSYGGSAGNIYTSDVQVGSGATSITFTGLEDEPEYWSCIFKSNFSTSSGYQRVIAVRSDGTTIDGLEMDSSAKPALHWTASYSNGSLTITSQGTNAGGYFHQPGYYQLTYAVGGDSTLQKKTVTPTTSQQIVTADTAQGYTALSQVTVNAIPSSYVQPTSTVGATTYRASTSSQTISAGTYHSAAATIAAVSQTNLTAENIKSGTTISISNGQSNLWSVTGTYTGGGGGSVNIDTKTVTASNYPVSIEFTSMKGEPKMFSLRATSQISSSGNTAYYYIIDMRYNGTNTTGNVFRIGSTRQVNNITSGYSWSYSGTTLTITSSAASRSASPGAFNNTYELVYVY